MSNLKEILKREEGFGQRPYYCSEGKLTIGYGHCLETNPLTRSQTKRVCGASLSNDEAIEWLETHGISEERAEWLLEVDINEAKAQLLTKYEWMADLDEVRFEAIVQMVFQLGIAGVSRFHHMLRALRDGAYDKAADEALDSKWAEQTPERAERVAEQIRIGKCV